MPNGYVIGNVIDMTIQIKSDGALIDASPVNLRIGQPNGVVVTPAVSRVSLGVYTASFTPTMADLHKYRFEVPDSLAVQDEFIVIRSSVP